MPKKEERLRGQRFMVFWKARCMLPDRSLHESAIKTITQSGFAIELEQAVSLGKDVNIEFYVKYRDKDERIRVKTTVIYCMILSENRGAYMEVKIKQISNEEMHTLNNILQVLGESKEFDLRV